MSAAPLAYSGTEPKKGETYFYQQRPVTIMKVEPGRCLIRSWNASRNLDTWVEWEELRGSVEDAALLRIAEMRRDEKGNSRMLALPEIRAENQIAAKDYKREPGIKAGVSVLPGTDGKDQGESF